MTAKPQQTWKPAIVQAMKKGELNQRTSVVRQLLRGSKRRLPMQSTSV